MRAAFLLALCSCGRLGFEADEREIPHATSYERAGDQRLVVRGDIDTDADGIGSIAFVAIAQDGGPALALVDVDTFVVEPGSHVRVTGSRGLIIAARTIQIDGDLDAGGTGATAGAGASTTSGARGNHIGTDVCDHGGSGGGYATAGGDGGRGTSCDDSPRSPGGAAFGDATIAILVGGARGGDGVALECGDAVGGGGGGALELSAQDTLTIAGTVRASGGGGAGGLECNMNGDAGSGGGGGAGGAIYLDARRLVITGTVAAFGGGGGGGGNGNTDNGPVGVGANGTDGSATPGAGGAGIAPNAGMGGRGGGDAPPTSGGDVIHNGGGGGGAAGRIVIVGQ